VTKQTGLATIALSVTDGKVACLASVPKESVEVLPANSWLSTVLAEVSGRGGGKPAQAQGSGPEVANLPKAVEVAREVASKALGA
jgi:alanyl-tRNA synthetase